MSPHLRLHLYHYLIRNQSLHGLLSVAAALEQLLQRPLQTNPLDTNTNVAPIVLIISITAHAD